MADQGGAQVKIENVTINTNDVLAFEDSGFKRHCNWVVAGTVGHWGHLHRRKLGCDADFIVKPTDKGWKITSMQITDQSQPVGL